jgi:hypothetical protein
VGLKLYNPRPQGLHVLFRPPVTKPFGHGMILILILVIADTLSSSALMRTV